MRERRAAQRSRRRGEGGAGEREREAGGRPPLDPPFDSSSLPSFLGLASLDNDGASGGPVPRGASQRAVDPDKAFFYGEF